MLDKGMIHIPGGQDGTVRFNHTMGTVHNGKLRNCLFWDFPFNNFGLWMTMETEMVEIKTTSKGDLMYIRRPVALLTREGEAVLLRWIIVDTSCSGLSPLNLTEIIAMMEGSDSPPAAGIPPQNAPLLSFSHSRKQTCRQLTPYDSPQMLQPPVH
jgi:hypothetical protein